MANRTRRARAPLADDPLWYKDAVIYELHVRSFHDADGDGIGDFAGLVEKLDYLQDLGVTAIWLLPFYPSPLRDDGYDIAEYTQVNPSYGTLRDFKQFLSEAHARGLRVITELVLNHTSDQHPWFQRARRAPKGSRWRDFYVWSDTDQRYKDARVIFQDFEPSNWTWDPVAGAHFWHRFFHHQPDLNFENPAVHRALLRVVDFWFDMGVDGLRLDAVPYLYEREGTNCENLSETHGFLKELRAHVDANHKDRMLLAEANQWPEDAVAYFGQGDECHMNFHFPLMPRLWMAVRMEDRFPIVDIVKQTPEIPATCQWALFLRNHDELTLEMVTDQERDYMWRVYAHDNRARINLGIRRRLAPLLGNDRRKIELMKGLLFSLPGTPVIYYGDELGMGDNIWLGDRNGVRTPMQWSGDRNAGFSKAHPQSLFLPVIIDPECHFETVNVETQQKNASSMLWWMKRLIALRKRYHAFGRGSLEIVYPDNPKVFAFLRRHEEETLLVVANLSRFTQAASIDLTRFAGTVPVELFGRTALPHVEEGRPYFLTLGPHAFHWFALEPRAAHEGGGRLETIGGRVPVLTVDSHWEALLEPEARAALEEELPGFLRTRRWFGAKTTPIRAVHVTDAVPIAPGEAACLLVVHVEFFDRDAETYSVPLALVGREAATTILAERPGLVFARVRRPGAPDDAPDDGALVDGLVDPTAASALVAAVMRRSTLRGEVGRLVAAPSGRRLRLPEGGIPAASLLSAEQSNTSAVFGHRWVLKLFRALENGVNPDLEVGRFLTHHAFTHAARVEGELTYFRGPDAMTMGVLTAYVQNEGDAWRFSLDALSRYYERVLASDASKAPPRGGHLLERAIADHEGKKPADGARTDGALSDFTGVYPGMARLLGDRTARLHLALASDLDDPTFAPEPYAAHAQRSIMQGLRTTITRAFDVLRRQLARLPGGARAEAEQTLGLEGRLHERVRELLSLKLTAKRIRTHGDLHLGQVLYTGSDFVFIDFEGEPARPISERRMKRSALRDVAGLLRSLHYAAHAALESETIRPEDRDRLRPWADAWFHEMGAALLSEYLTVSAGAAFLPAARTELRLLLDLHLLEKALYELVYELDHRPAWIRLPLEGIRSIAASPAERT